MLRGPRATPLLASLRATVLQLHVALENTPGVLLLAGGATCESTSGDVTTPATPALSPVIHTLLYDPRSSGIREAFDAAVTAASTSDGGSGSVVNWYSPEIARFVADHVERGEREDYLVKVERVRRLLL